MSNYKCVIAKIDSVQPISGADFIHLAYVSGEQVIVSKTYNVGFVGALFVSGTQLSEEYCHNNNLFRETEKNKDNTKSGYFDNNRRVRAQPFKRLKSEAFFISLDSFQYTGTDISKLKIGDSFEELNNHKICTKYIDPLIKKTTKTEKVDKLGFKALYFKEHVETDQFVAGRYKIQKGDLVSIQSKRHGTSQRVGYMKTELKLPKWKQLINNVFPIFEKYKYEYILGSRRVILNPSVPNPKEQYRWDVAALLKPHLSKGMMVYIEIVGWNSENQPIMGKHKISNLKDKNYTKKYGDEIIYSYGANEGEFKFHIYRITITGDNGITIDFTQRQIVDWCNQRSLDPAYDVTEPFIFDGDHDTLLQKVKTLTERPEVLTEDYHDPRHISEGVIIRVDNGGLTPLFLKSKSYAFKVCEGLQQAIDIEETS